MSNFVLSKLDHNESYNISIGHCNNKADGEILMELIQNGIIQKM